jgi:hypothetical protein
MGGAGVHGEVMSDDFWIGSDQDRRWWAVGDFSFHYNGGRRAETFRLYIVRIIKEAKNRLGAKIF